MPTGYTAQISKGISFEDFVLRCSRAFGALMSMHDDPMDTEIPIFKPSGYHKKELKKAKLELKKLKSLTKKEIVDKLEREFKDEIEQSENYMDEKKVLKEKYVKMLSMVKAWQPPTPEHQKLKDFMVEQIESSIDFDCNLDYYKKPKKLTPEKWISEKIKKALWNINYHTKENIAEIERVNARNLWVKQLKESLSRSKNE